MKFDFLTPRELRGLPQIGIEMTQRNWKLR